MRKYSTAFKSKMVRQMSGPAALSAVALAAETGLSQPTLSRWLREAGGDKVATMKTKKRRPGDRSAEERLALLVEADTLCDEDLGAFLRRHGLHQAHLDAWRALALQALGDAPGRKPKPSLEARQVRELTKELHRKEKALAETAALLVLKKKAQAIWGGGDDDMDRRSGK
jgi:transposase-like protein